MLVSFNLFSLNLFTYLHACISKGPNPVLVRTVDTDVDFEYNYDRNYKREHKHNYGDNVEYM